VIVLTCIANGGTGDVNIVWSGPVVQLQPATIKTDNGIFISNLTLANANMFFSGVYQCTAGYDNSLCNANVSSNTTLDVIAPPSIVDQTQSPYIVDRGANLSLVFVFSAHPSFTNLRCSGPNGNIEMNTSSIHLTRKYNFNAFQIRVVIDMSSINHTDGGIYSCDATNIAGSDSATVLLLVRPIVEPELTLARNGDTVTFKCLAQSFPEPSYMWEMISITDSSGSGSLLDAFGSGSNDNQIITQPILEFKPVEYKDNGNYHCVIIFNGVWQVPSNEVLLAGR
jgi:hypothetical protein